MVNYVPYHHVVNVITDYAPHQAHILLDCESAITRISSIELHTSHQLVIDDIRQGVHNLKSRGTKIHLHWIAGHVNYKGNELAEQAAKEAAQEAVTLQTGPVRYYKHAKWTNDLEEVATSLGYITNRTGQI